MFFLIYVCYCFAMSTVFRPFFVSYLVEPGFGEKLTTFQELLDSSVNYGFVSAVKFRMRATDFSDHSQFPLTRRVDCFDLQTCLLRMIWHRTVGLRQQIQYSNHAKIPIKNSPNQCQRALVRNQSNPSH